eukprot:12935385-Prorocentrum_lima.AAC.1
MDSPWWGWRLSKPRAVGLGPQLFAEDEPKRVFVIEQEETCGPVVETTRAVDKDIYLLQRMHHSGSREA